MRDEVGECLAPALDLHLARGDGLLGRDLAELNAVERRLGQGDLGVGIDGGSLA